MDPNEIEVNSSSDEESTLTNSSVNSQATTVRLFPNTRLSESSSGSDEMADTISSPYSDHSNETTIDESFDDDNSEEFSEEEMELPIETKKSQDVVKLSQIPENFELEIVSQPSEEESNDCIHRMSMDLNLISFAEAINKESSFRSWFFFKRREPRIMQDLKNFCMTEEQGIEYLIRTLFQSEVCEYDASYECLYRYVGNLRLAVIIPYSRTKVSAILCSNFNLVHVELKGYKNTYIFDIMDIKEEYMINPHPTTLARIKFPFVVIGLVYFRPTHSLYLLCQKGPQCILISLSPDDNYVYVNVVTKKQQLEVEQSTSKHSF